MMMKSLTIRYVWMSWLIMVFEWWEIVIFPPFLEWKKKEESTKIL